MGRGARGWGKGDALVLGATTPKTGKRNKGGAGQGDAVVKGIAKGVGKGGTHWYLGRSDWLSS